MAHSLVPLLLANLGDKPAAPDAAALKLYARQGQLRLLRADNQEVDLVLDRKLDAYKRASKLLAITSADTVRSAIEKLEARIAELESNPSGGTLAGYIMGGNAAFKGPLTKNPFR